MKAVQINISCQSGSTGRLCAAISDLLTQKQIENYVLYYNGADGLATGIKYTDKQRVNLAALASRVMGNWGFEGRGSTRRLIALLEQIQPDVIHLHNLHSHACSLEMLFAWIRKRRVKVLWTMHDCWAFTGYCVHYDMIGCDRWRTGCHDCPQKRSYSWFFDRSAALWQKKKELTRGLDLTLIAPSEWAAQQTRQSFLGNYPVKVIYNGIDLKAFCPTESDTRSRYGVGEKRLVLGVAYGWGRKKGLDVFVELAGRLGSEYRILLVGVSEQQAAKLPPEIIPVSRTQDQSELAALYTAADVFVNPTREEVLGMTNLEALACGTPVITFDSGGSPETIDDSCGAVVKKDDIAALESEIIRVCEEKPYASEACIARARRFEIGSRFRDYIRLYEEEGLC